MKCYSHDYAGLEESFSDGPYSLYSCGHCQQSPGSFRQLRPGNLGHQNRGEQCRIEGLFSSREGIGRQVRQQMACPIRSFPSRCFVRILPTLSNLGVILLFFFYVFNLRWIKSLLLSNTLKNRELK